MNKMYKWGKCVLILWNKFERWASKMNLFPKVWILYWMIMCILLILCKAPPNRLQQSSTFQTFWLQKERGNRFPICVLINIISVSTKSITVRTKFMGSFFFLLEVLPFLVETIELKKGRNKWGKKACLSKKGVIIDISCNAPQESGTTEWYMHPRASSWRANTVFYSWLTNNIQWKERAIQVLNFTLQLFRAAGHCCSHLVTFEVLPGQRTQVTIVSLLL